MPKKEEKWAKINSKYSVHTRKKKMYPLLEEVRFLKEEINWENVMKQYIANIFPKSENIFGEK